MRFGTRAIGWAAVICLAAGPVAAAQKPSKPPKAAMAGPKAAKPVKTPGSGGAGGAAAALRPKSGGPPAHAAAAAAKAVKAPKAPKVQSKAPHTKLSPVLTSPAQVAAKGRGHGRLARAPSATVLPSVSPVAAKIVSRPNLAAKVQRQLPAGLTIEQAALGFRNQGQFIAATNVSRNLGLDFLALRALMTGPNALSLGQAIQQLKGPRFDATTAALLADRQTRLLLSETTTTQTRVATRRPRK